MNLKKMIKKIYNSFLKRQITKKSYLFTKDIFRDKKYVIGDLTYGCPTVLWDNEDANLYIGKFCSIAGNVKIYLGGNHRVDWISTYPFNAFSEHFPYSKNIKGHPLTKGNVVIGNDVWIGNDVTIMSGITIGDGAVIASNSKVVKDIGAYEMWGGNPAVLIKKRFSEEDIQFLLDLKWWDFEKEKVSRMADKLCSHNINELKKALVDDIVRDK